MTRGGARRRWGTGRLLVLLLALAAAAVVASFVLFLAWRPGDDEARRACGRSCTPAKVEELKRFLGLDDPIHVDYAEYLELVWECRDIDPPPFLIDPERSRCDQPEE